MEQYKNVQQFQLKNLIIWLPIMVLLINAAVQVLYFDLVLGGLGHAGGSFGPYCSPLYKYVVVTKFSVDDKFYLYKGNLGSPIKYLMLPSKNVIDEIGKRILFEEKFLIKYYPRPFGNLRGEISVANEEINSIMPKTIISKETIDFVQLDMWQLDDDQNVIKLKTKYSLVSSFKYK